MMWPFLSTDNFVIVLIIVSDDPVEKSIYTSFLSFSLSFQPYFFFLLLLLYLLEFFCFFLFDFFLQNFLIQFLLLFIHVASVDWGYLWCRLFFATLHFVYFFLKFVLIFLFFVPLFRGILLFLEAIIAMKFAIS